jgi:hypothetical protein
LVVVEVLLLLDLIVYLDLLLLWVVVKVEIMPILVATVVQVVAVAVPTVTVDLLQHQLKDMVVALANLVHRLEVVAVLAVLVLGDPMVDLD